MGNPIAAQTFAGFARQYISQRTGGVPGSGTWSVNSKIFDIATWSTATDGTAITEGSSFSAGALALDDSDPRGMITQNAAAGMLYLGNGLSVQPINITYSGQVSNFIQSGYFDTSQGGWTFGGAQYFLGLLGSGTVVMLRTPDSGVTWAVQSTGFVVFGDSSTGMLQRVNNKIYCFFPTNFADTQWALWVFDLATNTWSAPALPITFASAALAHFINPWTNGVFVYANGDVGVFYYRTVTGVRTPFYIENVSGTWGAEVQLPGESCANIIIDPSGELLWLLTYGTHNDRDSAVHVSTVAHGGVLTADIFIIPATIGQSDGVGHCSIQNSLIFVPRDDQNDTSNAIWVANLSDGQFLKELLPLPSGESINNSSCAYMMFPNGYISAGIPLALPCPLASPGTVGQPFTETLIASGGVPPYTYAVAAGYFLPPGLSLDPVTGIISGTPTAEGTFDIAWMVTDSVGNTATT